MTQPSLVGSQVTYRVDRATLIENVDFHASPGELIGLLGPNGAGKTTLLRLLSGELVPSAGEVTVNGSKTTRMSPLELSRARSVLAHQIPTDLAFTVQSIVEMSRYPHRSDPANTAEHDRRAVTEAMRRTDTTRFAGRVFATLSSGERHRVFAARALAQEAPIVLLDEPTATLDVGNSESILVEMRRLADTGHTVIAVFHDLNAAARYSDRVTLLAEGRERLTGPVKHVLRSEILSDVYRQPMAVVEHPWRDCPLVLVDDRPPQPRR